MADETDLVPDEEVVTQDDAHPETSGDEEEAAAEEAEGEETGETEDEVEPELHEFQFGNSTFSVPKDQLPEELAEQIDRFAKGTWADYTRKSQGVAEREKAAELREQNVERLHGLQGDALTAFANGLHLQQEIARYEQQDMTRLWQEDPDRARAISDHVSGLRAQLQQSISETQRHEAEFQRVQSEEVARRTEEGRRAVEQKIKGFEPDKVMDYVMTEHGFTKDQAAQWPLNPAFAEMAHKAMLFDEMQKKARAQPKKPPPAPVKPATRGSGRHQSNQPSDNDSTEDWVAKRQRQINQRKGAG